MASYIPTIILELPSGVFADLYGRVKTSSIGYLIIGASIVGLGWLKNTPPAYISVYAFFFISAFGVGAAFISDTLEAWLVDKLKEIKRDEELTRVFGLYVGLDKFIAVIAGVIAIYIVKFGIHYAFITSGAINILAVPLLLHLPENYGGNHRSWLITFKDGIREFIKLKNLVILTIIGILITISSLNFLILTWQPLVIQYGVDRASLGLLYSILMISMGIGGCICSKLLSKMGYIKLTLTCISLLIISLLLIYFSTALSPIVFALLLLEIALGIIAPAFASWKNEIIPSTLRATVLSATSSVTATSLALSYVPLGGIIESIGIQNAALIGFMMLSPSIPLLLLLGRNRKNLKRCL
jgi:MFS family permease